MSMIVVYSQNVSGDRHSEKLIHHPGMAHMTFKRRVTRLIEDIPSDVDVVGLNEVSSSQ